MFCTISRIFISSVSDSRYQRPMSRIPTRDRTISELVGPLVNYWRLKSIRVILGVISKTACPKLLIFQIVPCPRVIITKWRKFYYECLRESHRHARRMATKHMRYWYLKQGQCRSVGRRGTKCQYLCRGTNERALSVLPRCRWSGVSMAAERESRECRMWTVGGSVNVAGDKVGRAWRWEMPGEQKSAEQLIRPVR